MRFRIEVTTDTGAWGHEAEVSERPAIPGFILPVIVAAESAASGRGLSGQGQGDTRRAHSPMFVPRLTRMHDTLHR